VRLLRNSQRRKAKPKAVQKPHVGDHSRESASVYEYVALQRCGLVGMSLDENRAFLEVTPRGAAKSTFRAVSFRVIGPTHVCRCTRTVPKHIELEVLGLALSEKQIPQIVENNESGTERMEPLEGTGVRPRQARYQPAKVRHGDKPSKWIAFPLERLAKLNPSVAIVSLDHSKS
jgi:hypothetical protein